MTDYLWDRSGEPDNEIQELEELLAPLAYQPRPLEIPATIQPGRRRNLYPVLAIAAAVAMVALALGIWFNIQRDAEVTPQKASAPVPVENKDPESASLPDETTKSPVVLPNANANPKPRPLVVANGPVRRNRRAVHDRPSRKSSQAQREMSAAATLEAEAGKEQLMVALRVASAKLNHAVKRAQGGPANLIRNQHKVG